MKRLIYIMLGLVGFILAIGTIGAADQENITFMRVAIQSLIGGALVGIACFGLNLEEERDKRRRHR